MTCSLIGLGCFCFQLGCFASQNGPFAPKHSISEASQVNGLRWLQRHQSWDGSWGSDTNKTYLTGLAVFAFLNHGESPESKEFGRTVNRGLVYLVKSVEQDGWVRSRNLRTQGVVTFTLAEGYGMTRSPVLQKSLTQIVRVSSRVVEEIAPMNQMSDDDLMAMVWLVSSLRLARLSGVEVSPKPLARMKEKLWAAYGQNGEFITPDGRRSPTRTTACVYSLQLMGKSGDPRLKRSLDYLLEQTKTGTENRDWLSPETRYFLSQVMFHGGGGYLQYHNDVFFKEMLEAQEPDGHWASRSAKAIAGKVEISDLSTTIFNLVSFPVIRYVPIHEEPE